MKAQAFMDMAVSLAICLLFAMLLAGLYIGVSGPAWEPASGLASSINGTSRFVAGLVEQLHYG